MMPVDLGGALVGWLMSSLGDAGIRLVRRSRDKLTLCKAMRLAIDGVVAKVDPSSQYALRLGLDACFSAPTPRLELDASTPVSEGLRAAIVAQVGHLDRTVHGDTAQPFYEVVRVDRAWLVEQVTAAILMALRQVAAASGLVELVHGLDAADMLELHNVRTTPAAPVIVRVQDADPRLLGVHPVIHVDGAQGYLPKYVPRDTDSEARGVRALISVAAQHGGFVLLVGGSSVGKTRCAYEAVTALLPEWQLQYPAAGSDHLARLATDPVPQTVVWLDELQRYLGGRDGLTADSIRALLTAPGPVLLVASLWPRQYSIYTTLPRDGGGEDPYRWEREVLALAEVIHLDQEWSEAELQRASEAAADDPRIEYAVSAGGGFSVPQVLAAAPQLVECWDNAETYAAGVLAAAVDVTRLGYKSPLPPDLLRRAAVGYYDSRTRAIAPVNWFECAIAYCTAPLHGAVSALESVAAGMGEIRGYTVADYLLQYAAPKRHRQPIPRPAWDALLIHTNDPTDASCIGRAASNRLLYSYARPLLHRSANAGDSQAADRLIDLLIAQGATDDAILFLYGRATEPVAAELLAKLLAEQGDTDALRQRAEAGDTFAAYWLTELLAEQGDTDALRQRAEAGDTGAAERLADVLAEQGDLDGAIALLREHDAVEYLSFEARWFLVRIIELFASVLAMHGYRDLDAIVSSLNDRDGKPRAGAQLVELLTKPGETETPRWRAGAAHPLVAAQRLAQLFAKRGDLDALRERSNAGDFYATAQLAKLLAEQYDTNAAIMLLREHADAGDPFAALALAKLLAKAEDTDSLRERSHAGDPFAAVALSGLLVKRGNADAAITLLREHAGSGHLFVSITLHQLLAERSDADALRERAAGDPFAIVELAERGDADAAIALLRERADAGSPFAAIHLADLLTKENDAETLLLAEVQVGNSGYAAAAWLQVLERSENPADRDRAEHMRRSGITPSTPRLQLPH